MSATTAQTTPTTAPASWMVTCDSSAEGHGFDHPTMQAARDCTYAAEQGKRWDDEDLIPGMSEPSDSAPDFEGSYRA